MAKEVAESIIDRLNLDYIGLAPNDVLDIIEDIVSGIVESRATPPSTESIIKNIMYNKKLFLKAVAARLLERDTLTLEQLEFIIANAEDLAGRMAPRIYRAARNVANSDHIIDALKHLWIQYGNPTPLECPYCGFRGVTPDLTCVICGSNIDEEKLKEKIGFTRLLESFASTADPPMLDEILRAGYVIIGEDLKPPSMHRRGEYGVQLYLSRTERDLLKRRLASIFSGRFRLS